MENKSSLKYYLLGAIVLIVVIVLIFLSVGKSKPALENSQAVNSTNTSAASAMPVANSTSTSGLVGTWVSAVSGKGLEGSGKVVTSRSSTEITAYGDVKIVIEKIENNTAVGTITYTNMCYTTVTTISGKAGAARPPQCLTTGSSPARLQVTGNTISYDGQTALSSNVSFTGKLTGDAISGTFTRTGTYGKISGTINLVRAKSN